jgi:hypothetical protein
MVLANLSVIVLWSTHAPPVQLVASVAFAVISAATWSMDVQFPKFAVKMDSVLITKLCALPSHPTVAISLEFQLHINAMMDPVLQVNPNVSYQTAATLQHLQNVLPMAGVFWTSIVVQQPLLQAVLHALMVVVFRALLIAMH